IDRIDSVNGVTRVIDYKTGAQIKQGDLNIKEYNMITEDKKYSNIFQLLFYCIALENNKKYNLPLESGIISFRNLSGGALKTKFLDKSTLVTTENLEDYKKGLENLIKEILDINTSFKEKEIEKSNKY
ncbi:MAG TPA: PD-(D/E)XK nuclease family protein, partial [Flavobacteriaceae bacterium]|nr:PD-(D/E)XK nuclease family protein [Flavobacteriaceae bacterium]